MSRHRLNSLALQHNAKINGIIKTARSNPECGIYCATSTESRMRNILLAIDGIQNAEYILLDIDGIHVVIVIAGIELARIVRGDARSIGIFRQSTRGSALVACDAVLGGAVSPGGKRQIGGRGTAAAVGCCRTFAKTRDVFVGGGRRRLAAIPVRRLANLFL
jgi:hypothetical protein